MEKSVSIKRTLFCKGGFASNTKALKLVNFHEILLYLSNDNKISDTLTISTNT